MPTRLPSVSSISMFFLTDSSWPVKVGGSQEEEDRVVKERHAEKGGVRDGERHF